MTCQSCPFYHHQTQVCRRFPGWENRGPDDWCGEHPDRAPKAPELPVPNGATGRPDSGKANTPPKRKR